MIVIRHTAALGAPMVASLRAAPTKKSDQLTTINLVYNIK